MLLGITFSFQCFKPDSVFALTDDAYLKTISANLKLPEETKQAFDQKRWRTYTDDVHVYEYSKDKYLNSNYNARLGVTLDDIWDGDKTNKNAMLTIFRHFDNSTVVKGWQGQYPKTHWVLNYPLFEKIHYLLVANFNVFGNVSHQLFTRMYMDFLRLEGEENFRSLLPIAERHKNREYWNQGYIANFRLNLKVPLIPDTRPTGISFPKTPVNYVEHAAKSIFRKNKGLVQTDRINRCDTCKAISNNEEALRRLSRVKGESLKFLPPVIFMRLSSGNKHKSYKTYTLVHNNDHTNVLFLFYESLRRNYKR